MKEEDEEKWQFDLRVSSLTSNSGRCGLQRLTVDFDACLQPAAETYLKELAVHHAEVVVPVLRAFKESTSSTSTTFGLISLRCVVECSNGFSDLADPQSFEGMLLKEAAYTALGKCPAEMNKVMPFRDLLRSELLPQAQGTDER